MAGGELNSFCLHANLILPIFIWITNTRVYELIASEKLMQVKLSFTVDTADRLYQIDKSRLLMRPVKGDSSKILLK